MPKKRSKSATKLDYRYAFKPAALKKNEPFFDDKTQYGLEQNKLKEFYQESKKVNKKYHPR